MRHTPRRPDDRVNVSDTPPLREALWLSTALIVIVAVVVVIAGLGVDFAVRFLPWQTGVSLRDDIEQALVQEFGAPSKSGRAPRARALFADLVATADIDADDVRLLIVANDDVNALAVPGGIIVLFDGLLDEVHSLNELAMILGHEIGHLQNKDHLRALGRGLILGTLGALVFGNNGLLERQLLSAPATALQRRHSRRRERAADSAGLALLCAHYGHSGGSADFFARHANEAAAFGFFATHPASAERVAALGVLAAARGCPGGETTLW